MNLLYCMCCIDCVSLFCEHTSECIGLAVCPLPVWAWSWLHSADCVLWYGMYAESFERCLKEGSSLPPTHWGYWGHWRKRECFPPFTHSPHSFTFFSLFQENIWAPLFALSFFVFSLFVCILASFFCVCLVSFSHINPSASWLSSCQYHHSVSTRICVFHWFGAHGITRLLLL